MKEIRKKTCRCYCIIKSILEVKISRERKDFSYESNDDSRP